MTPAGRQFVLGLIVGLTLAFVAASFYIVSNNPVQQAVVEKIHEKVLKIIASHSPDTIQLENDTHMHHDDDSVAKRLYNQVRVLVWVMTAPTNLEKKAKIVKNTWAKRCNKVIFFSSEDDAEFPTIGLNVSEGRDHLTAKTMKGFRYIYEHHFDEADWFMKADDDTYVIVENLRYFLSDKKTSEPVFYGHHFHTIVKQGYYSGGGGYVLSKEALRRLGEKGHNSSLCSQDFGAEDVEIGRCLEKLQVRTANSTDNMNRSRFHCFKPEDHIFGNYPNWYYEYDSHGAPKGSETISDYAISFHYVTPPQMIALEFYIYHLKPYGIKYGQQDLNRPDPESPKS